MVTAMTIYRCDAIHTGDDCAQELEADWLYCPLCGRSTGEAVIDPIEFTVPYQTATDREFPLRNMGRRNVAIEMVLVDPLPGAVLSGTRPNILAPEAQAYAGITIPSLSEDCQLASVHIETNDKPRQSDPWQPEGKRQQQVPIWVKVQTPADIRPLEAAAIFRRTTSERLIHLRNYGAMPGTCKIQPPSGYSCDQRECLLAGHETKVIKLRRLWQEFPVIDPRQTLQLHVLPGNTHKVTLYSLRDPARNNPPDVIVGIDFGTAYTSVVLRQCGRDPERDEITFLQLNGKDRFPTRIWIDKNDRDHYLIGEEATAYYNNNTSQGYLFREIKTLLRIDVAENIAAVKVSPAEQISKENAIQCATARWGTRWPQMLVTLYLKKIREELIERKLGQLYGDEAASLDIRYVISLPVLDNDRIAQQQERAMRHCLTDAGYPIKSALFKWEPFCAAFGLLNPPKADQDPWPIIGSEQFPINHDHGSYILVFDSGGGTTDVVLGLARTDPATGRVAMELTGCLGVGTSAETFGGESVTDGLADTVARVVPDPGPACYEGEQGKLALFLAVNNWNSDILDEEEIRRRKEGEPDLHATINTYNEDIRAHDFADQLKRQLQERASVVVNTRTGTPIVKAPLLRALVADPLTSVGEALQRGIFHRDITPGDVTYYICLGGNSFLRPLEDWVERYMEDPLCERHLRIPDRARHLAVAYGTVWVPGARVINSVPYGMQVLFNGEEWWNVSSNTRLDASPPPQSDDLQAGDQSEIQVLGIVGDHAPECLTWATLVNVDKRAMRCRYNLSVNNLALQVSATYTYFHENGSVADKQRVPLITLAL